MLTGLKQRGTRWYIRRRVPADLVEAFGSKEANRALGTSDYKIARQKLPIEWAKLDQEFRSLRAKGVAPKQVQQPVDPAQVAASFIKKLRERRELAAADGKLAEFNEYLKDQLANHQAVLDGDLHPVVPVTTHEGTLNALRALLTGEGAMAIQTFVQISARTVPEAGEHPTVSELHKLWLQLHNHPKSTLAGMRRAVERFIKIIGDKPLVEVSRSDLVTFTDKMREPGTVTAPGVSVPSMNTTLSLLSALFGFAVKRNLIETNPARSMQLKDDRSRREKRRDFDGTALQAIFSSPVYTSDERFEGGGGEAVYWLPLLALYSGMRIAELCQLRPHDIAEEMYLDQKGQERKAWVTRVENDKLNGHRLKTPGSERRIPVHADLIKLGFIGYATAQRDEPLLFSALKPSPDRTNLSGNFGRWWGRYLRNVCGVTDPKMTFHSFRHTFKHHMRQCQISKEVHNALTGHETGDAADAYGGFTFPLLPLVEGMKKYRVVGLSLPRPPPAFR